MQLNKVYIDGYKNLIKTSIEIQPADIPIAIIGNNGTGKSNLIEALLHIFSVCTTTTPLIKKLVNRGDDYEPDRPAMENVKEDLLELMDRKSPYSKAAECYIRCFRDCKWIEQLLFDKE